MSIIETSKKYKGFEVLDITEIPDCESTGIYLRHKKTGLEVFHLLNSDDENLFAFTFRTPPENSCGAAHILEHSVLCGSEKYPLKDPFIRLVNQSVKTYLNALTFPDRTVFPASSMIKQDYFNLMSVYGDAVFFPRLEPEIFKQEAHRLETDGKGNYSIQGVVYNEMKGNYSSFDSVAGETALHSIFPGTIYTFDFGGDPLQIPFITYEQLKAFHTKHYRSNNCLVFLYGNIPTEIQLDFLQEQLLDRIERNNSDVPACKPDEILSKETVTPFIKPVFVEGKGPASDKKIYGATVTVNWLLGETDNIIQYMESIILFEILYGHDGSPLRKALLDSGLGEDIAPGSGILSEVRYIMMTVGLRGVEQKNIREVERCILKTLNRLCESGITSGDVESAMMSVGFANREVIRSGGPYSLVLLRRVLRSWTYGKKPAETLGVREAFDKIKKNIQTDPDYITGLIRRLLLENNHRSLVSVTPDSSYTKERDDIEQKIISDAVVQTSGEIIKQEMDSLHKYQQSRDDEKQQDCLPHIRPDDLALQTDNIKTEITVCRYGNISIPLFLNQENTNGIVYLEVAFPADTLQPSEYPYLPFFSIAATNCGWKGKNWAETATLSGLTCGSLSAGLFTSSEVPDADKNLPYTGRDWIMFRIKMLSEKIEASLDLLSDCLTGTLYDDPKRLQDLANEYRNDFDEEVIPDGHEFACSRASCTWNRSKAVDEIWNGLSQLFTAHKISETNMAELGRHLSSLSQTIRAGGAIIHITADKDSMVTIVKNLPAFAEKTELEMLKQKNSYEEEEFYRLTVLPAKKPLADKNTEICIAQSQTGFAAIAFPASPWLLRECAAELVLSHWLSSTLLWEQIRTVGGAYGAVASVDAIEKLFTIITYRDPAPMTSIGLCISCLEKASKANFSTVTVEKAVTGTYSREIQPRSPAGRGNTGFLRILYGITEEDRKRKLEAILSVTGAELETAAERLLHNSVQNRKAVICGKNVNSTETYILLPV